jgi:hypothetical protein
MLRKVWDIGIGCGMGLFALYACNSRKQGVTTDFRDISYDVYDSRVVFNAVGAGGRDLFILDLKSRHVLRLTNSREREFDPRFAHKGQRIVYAAYLSERTTNPSALHWIDVRSRQVHPLTQSRFADFEPRYLPNGTHLLFSRAHRLRKYSLGGTVWNETSAYLLDETTGSLYPLGMDLRGNLSPEGELLVVDGNIAYLDLNSLKSKLVEHNAEKNREIILSHLKQNTLCHFLTKSLSKPSPPDAPGSLHEWVWVEEGKALVILGIVPSNSYQFDLWYVRSDGTGLRRLTHLRDYLECLRYDPMHQTVYFLRLEDPVGMKKSLWSIHLPNGHLEKVADASLFSDPMTFKQ